MESQDKINNMVQVSFETLSSTIYAAYNSPPARCLLLLSERRVNAIMRRGEMVAIIKLGGVAALVFMY